MIIADIESIIVTTHKDEVVAIISEKEIVEKEGYKVILEPACQSF